MTTEEAFDLQTRILQKELSEAELLEVLTTLDRPLSADELYGLYAASLEAMLPVTTDIRAIDTCGTGGDGLNTFNISTTAAFLVAALGVPVAKHGNRSASSACGSADLLEALGVSIELEPEAAAACLAETGFCFMFAPRYHPAFKHAAVARKKFGRRTYFNLLGPLLNPAHAPYRLVGVSDSRSAAAMGEALIRSGVERIWIAEGESGMDEISPAGETRITEYVTDSAPTTFSIVPEQYGLTLTPLDALAGGDAEHNAAVTRSILSGQGTEGQANAVILNAAAALAITGKVSSFNEGVAEAQAGLAAGSGLRKLEEVVHYTATL